MEYQQYKFVQKKKQEKCEILGAKHFVEFAKYYVERD